jgi:hypothetical protein
MVKERTTMRNCLNFLGMVLCLTLGACNGQGVKNQSPSPASNAASTPSRPARAVGKVMPAEPIAGSSATYAWYLPVGYDPARPAPLVVFFDSHARGKDPVKHYKDLADQFQTILVGSNASRNGQQPPQSLQIYDELMRDVRAKFAVDEGRITASGFSGGARVAAMVAQNRGEVKNVIACSAGFQPRQGDRFNYYAIVGWEDFNLGELQQLEGFLDGTAQKHVVAYWEGGHEWPPVEVMREAFDFVRFRTLEPGDAAKDSLVADAMKRFEMEKQAHVQGSLPMWRGCKALVAKLNGLADLSKLEREMLEMTKGRRFAEDKAKEDVALETEVDWRNHYVPLIATESVDEWRKMATHLRNNHGANARELHLADVRVLNFLSLNTYFQVDRALKSGDLARTEHFLQIYALVDPENPEHAYLTAVVRMRQGRPDDAVMSLQAARGLGFKDAGRMEAEPDFVRLKGDTRFEKILAEVRAAE